MTAVLVGVHDLAGLGPVRLIQVGGTPQIPGAVSVSLDADLAAPPGVGGRHPLPEHDALQALWDRAGVSANIPVVCCDRGDGALAARAWWLLRYCGHQRAYLLDGGLQAWAAAGSPDIEIAGGAGGFTVSVGSMPTVTTAQLAAGYPVLDARAPERYRGEVEPLDGRAGRIPGAVNLPYLSLQTGDGTMVSEQVLRAAFAGIGSGNAAVSCGSGVTACYVIAAAAQLGIELALYPGSYSGWLAAGMDVEVG